jgi:protein arginine kinase activator
VGKVARRHEGAGHRLRLRTQLREAIAREDYEEAARLRDLLRPKDPQV